MHILLVTEFFPNLDAPVFSGGVETRIYYTALSLSKKHHIAVLARRKAGQKAKQIRGNLSVFHLGQPVSTTVASLSSIFPRLKFIFQALNKAKTVSADIVEGSNFISMVPAYLIGKHKKVPTVSWYPDVLIGSWVKQFGFLVGILGESLERILTELSWDHYITISEAACERLVRSGVKPGEVTVIPCGVEKTKTQQLATKSNRKESLVLISRLVTYKRVDWAIRLLKKLAPDYPNLKLTVIGTGSQEKNLKKLANKLNIRKKISFLKNISQEKKSQILGQALVLVHPSIIEGFGIVLVEAAILGTPFVAADIPTSKALQSQLNSGLTFKNSSFADFIRKTKKLLDDSEYWGKLSKSGSKNAQDFSWDKLGKQTEEVYGSIVAKSRV
jgi:glycosyltransferase involved in cell wall biosynthesis